MKNLFLSLLFSFSGLLAYAGSTKDQAKGQAEFNFEKTTVDYGTINKGDDGHREFKFTNTGTKPLIIQDARSSCGCTVPSFPKEPIAPGATGVIKVKYNTYRIGKINKSITIRANTKKEITVLKIKGEVKDSN